MSPREQAELFYRPDDERQAGEEREAPGGTPQQLLDAERVLLPLQGVRGVGQTVSGDGEATVVAYVDCQDVLNRLPATAGGMPVVGEITGEIGPL